MKNLFLISIISTLALPAFADDLLIYCDLQTKANGQQWENEVLKFVSDSTSSNQVERCGETYDDCTKKGFKDYITCEDSGCYNNPILIAKNCLRNNSTDKYFETRIGVIPSLNKITYSIRPNGQDDQRVWNTIDYPSSERGKFGLNVTSGNFQLNLNCKTMTKDRVGSDILAAFPKLDKKFGINTCN